MLVNYDQFREMSGKRGSTVIHWLESGLVPGAKYKNRKWIISDLAMPPYTLTRASKGNATAIRKAILVAAIKQKSTCAKLFGINQKVYDSYVEDLETKQLIKVMSDPEFPGDKFILTTSRTDEYLRKQGFLGTRGLIKELTISVLGMNMSVSFDDNQTVMNSKIEQREQTISDVNRKKPTLFLSYCGKDTPVAQLIQGRIKELLKDRIQISIYTELNYKDSFKTFMDSIQDHDYVMCIVSDHYLKSKPCMYEVGEIIKDYHYQKKLLFIIVGKDDEGFYGENIDNFAPPNVYGSAMDRMSYTTYWKVQYDSLSQEIKKIDDPVATRKFADELRDIENIYKNDIGEFVQYLADHKGISLREHLSEDFYELIRNIFPDYSRRVFDDAKNIGDLLCSAIIKVSEITGTDYNQIALNARLNSYDNALVVFADKITSPVKQVYRQVHMKGLMGKAYSTGKIVNVPDVEKSEGYFCAVDMTKSEIVIPIRVQGNIVGVFNSESEKKYFYSSSMINSLTKLSEELSIALMRLGYSNDMNVHNVPYIHLDK